MNVDDLRGGLVVSVQAGDDSVLNAPETIATLASCAEANGAVGVRIEGIALIAAVRDRVRIPIVGIGAFVLLAGLCISFYLLPARLYVEITGEGRRWQVGIAATTVKGYEIFEERFNELVEALRRSEDRPRTGGTRIGAPAPA